MGDDEQKPPPFLRTGETPWWMIGSPRHEAHNTDGSRGMWTDATARSRARDAQEGLIRTGDFGSEFVRNPDGTPVRDRARAEDAQRWHVNVDQLAGTGKYSMNTDPEDDKHLPPMPPPETALRGGFYQAPTGPAPPTLPFRPPTQPIPEPPSAPPQTPQTTWAQHFAAARRPAAGTVSPPPTQPAPAIPVNPQAALAAKIRALIAQGMPAAQAIQAARSGS